MRDIVITTAEQPAPGVEIIIDQEYKSLYLQYSYFINSRIFSTEEDTQILQATFSNTVIQIFGKNLGLLANAFSEMVVKTLCIGETKYSGETIKIESIEPYSITVKGTIPLVFGPLGEEEDYEMEDA